MSPPRLVAVGLAAALTAPLAGCGEPRRPTPEPAKETTMDDALRALERQPDAVISIQQGTEHWRTGQVTVTVRGRGQVEVEQRQAGTVRRFQRELTPAQLADLGRELATHRLTARRTSELPREPGDTPLVLKVDGLGPSFTASLWAADRYTDRDLDAIVRLADRLAHTASDGALGSP